MRIVLVVLAILLTGVSVSAQEDSLSEVLLECNVEYGIGAFENPPNSRASEEVRLSIKEKGFDLRYSEPGSDRFIQGSADESFDELYIVKQGSNSRFKIVALNSKTLELYYRKVRGEVAIEWGEGRCRFIRSE